MAQYIDKDALVAEIEKYYNECLKRARITDSYYWNAKADAYRNVLAILNDTLEVKEADLEKEVTNWWNEYYKNLNGDYEFGKYNGHYMINSTIMSLAKHFFELGLKSKRE